jgi:hypothetical protein
MTMIHITDTTALDDRELVERFVRATGARGQNARKEATAVELRFDIRQSSLPPDVKKTPDRASGPGCDEGLRADSGQSSRSIAGEEPTRCPCAAARALAISAGAVSKHKRHDADYRDVGTGVLRRRAYEADTVGVDSRNRAERECVEALPRDRSE